MKTILQTIRDTPADLWDYYLAIDNDRSLQIPFLQPNAHTDFIRRYFSRAGKVDIFNTSGIDVHNLHRSHHINSVFFLGILFYYRTGLHKIYKMKSANPGYQSFPFLWFLIALFHDNAYAYEIGQTEMTKLDHVRTMEDLKKHFNINYFLLDTKFRSNAQELLKSRNSYFLYRRNSGDKVVDHGLLGGILLYDRLYKIRERKKQLNDETSFWSRSLIYQYKMAANAISLHNIWLPDKKNEKDYIAYGLQNLIGLNRVKFRDFPLFYLLAAVDTIEPLKAFESSGFDDAYILDNLEIEFTPRSVTISNKNGSELEFAELIHKLRYFDNWLDLDYKKSETSLTIIFH